MPRIEAPSQAELWAIIEDTHSTVLERKLALSRLAKLGLTPDEQARWDGAYAALEVSPAAVADRGQLPEDNNVRAHELLEALADWNPEWPPEGCVDDGLEDWKPWQPLKTI
ncbi:MAG: hypothetical protein ABSF66_03505 [Terriglobales bacterium]